MENQKKIDNILLYLSAKGINVYLQPSEDPHLSEYPSDHWKLREFISGFTGSNGFLILSQFGNGLWTDSRYYLQASKELASTDIKLYKEDAEDGPWMNWLYTIPKEKVSIGLNGLFFSEKSIQNLVRICNELNFELNTNVVLEEEKNMPSLPYSPIFIHDEIFNGLSFQETKKKIFSEIDSDYLLICSLDEIAWLLNLRGNDTLYNPVFISYALIGVGKSYLAIDNRKLTDDVKIYLKRNNIEWLPDYECFADVIRNISEHKSIALDPSKTNHTIFECIKEVNRKIVNSPIEQLKCIKSATELKNLQHAVEKDGVALTKAIAEINERIDNGFETKETDISAILKKHRSKENHFKCESFSTIAGYGSNGAIVHYNATEEDCKVIGKDNLLLVDSGANYLDGTTDITRVFCFGEPTIEQKHDYTLVLKGHIAIATCKFPSGTSGGQIDALAHQFLWKENLDYGHGTGHGIGFFLCVHEGPQRISRKNSDAIIKENMILSDEPGLYRAGRYGIRIENMIAVQKDIKNEFGTFFKFETLTLFPYEPKLIDKTMLTNEEIEWINSYHKKVFDKLSPFLTKEKDLTWLKFVTKEL